MLIKVVLHQKGYEKRYNDKDSFISSGSYKKDAEVQEWIAEGNTPEEYQITELTYAELRAAEYPPIGEQLDMLYHAIDSGVFGEDAKNINFFTSLKAVKEKYPKEDGGE